MVETELLVDDVDLGEDFDESEDEPELVDFADAPNVEPMEVAAHSEGDRDPG
jgi:hypothetical protein